MEDELYREVILDLYRSPMHKYLMTDFDIHVHGANPSCGDEYQLFAKTKDGVVIEMSYVGEGCAISNAAFSLLADHVKGKPVAETLGMTAPQMKEMLGVDISYAREKCAMLALKTLQTAL
jgi:nitrogen fixation NifU-like protein